ncbi:MAG TPA: hypothetical protein VFU46_00080 [Gemmatimonadales bacterium]|nr:hypothetical protein [Gemmatimonadales bacterium]
MLSLSPGWPWVTVALLGAFHGINPGMGWLFAVGLGLQEGRRGAVVSALAPLALGHAVSVGAVILALGGARLTLQPGVLRVAAAGALIGFGLFRLTRPWARPRWVGMRVGFRDLTLWSFLMSSAHGAGLMLAPVVLGMPMAHGDRAEATLSAGIALLGLHTLAMFLVMGAVALVVYQIVGLELLRRAWVNLDLLWAGALLVAGVLTLAV